ncbi:MAG: phage major capsid protein, partial [Oscillospiraceae bacterium]|nr:phage major capsid protein [Oscillospiraceae bacterium]
MLDFKAKINELKQEKTTLQDKAEGFINEGNLEEAKKINDQLSKINEQISVIENLAAHSEENAEPAKPEPKKEPEKLFTNFGEQLIAVYNTKKGIFDKRLDTINNAVQGSNVGVGADGGFAVQEDFAGKILESAATTGEILSRVDGY